MNFLTRSLRSIGMLVIFLSSVVFIFTSIIRGIDESTFFNKFLNYTISFENRFYDFRMKSTLDPQYLSQDIVLVEIDDYSLQKLGTWPIPRTIHAQMIDKLNEYGAKVVALDILFPEKSPLMGNLSPDQVLADSIKKFQNEGNKVIIGFTLTSFKKDALSEIPIEMYNHVLQTKNQGNFKEKRISKYSFPIEKLVSSEVGLGIIEAQEDADGVFRQYPIAANIETIYFGSLAYNAFESYVDQKFTILTHKDGSGELSIKNKKVEIAPTGEIKIRYVGGKNQFPHISLYDLIHASPQDNKIRNLIKNKMIFVGSTALGAHDLRPSPIDTKMPGVYAHMNMAQMLIDQNFYQPVNDSIVYTLVLLVLSLIIFLVIQRRGNALLDALALASILYGYYLLDQHYFLINGFELKLFYSFTCIIGCYSWNTFLKFYETNKEKKQIRGTFARYVAPTVVNEMLKNPDQLQVGGSKKDITCLFSDIRGFTQISESLSAEDLARALNRYMGAMTDIIFETKGTLDKYIGDAIVALWGAPLEIGNHAQFAVEAAIKMMTILPQVNEDLKQQGAPEFQIGIGLNSGECSVGNMGSSKIFSYTALGDNMNLGARLESLCKHYGTQILISEMTLVRINQTTIRTRPIDRVVVKGKTAAVAIFEVLHPHHWLFKDLESHKKYIQAYNLYKNKKFKEALVLFQQLLNLNAEDKPTKRFAHLCQNFIENEQNLEENFDVTTMKVK